MGVRLISNYAEELHAKAELGTLKDEERPMLARAKKFKASEESRLKTELDTKARFEKRQKALAEARAKKES
jgi:hypothetical protein